MGLGVALKPRGWAPTLTGPAARRWGDTWSGRALLDCAQGLQMPHVGPEPPARLPVLQVFKNSLTTLPMGGGKGGSDFDPKGALRALRALRAPWAGQMGLGRQGGHLGEAK